MLPQALYRIAVCMMRNHAPDSRTYKVNWDRKYSIMPLLPYTDMHLCIQHKAIIPCWSPGDTGYEKCKWCVCALWGEHGELFLYIHRNRPLISIPKWKSELRALKKFFILCFCSTLNHFAADKTDVSFDMYTGYRTSTSLWEKHSSKFVLFSFDNYCTIKKHWMRNQMT